MNEEVDRKIEEFNPILRNSLIKKWAHLTDKKGVFGSNENVIYKRIAYSGAKLPPIPFYCYHRFRCIVTTHSGTL